MQNLNVSILGIPIPDKMKRLPISDRGYPTPWFVGTLPDGTRDFRCVDHEKMVMAIKRKLCWLCGQPLGQFMAFVIGPMCSITRTISEPPGHLDCADYSARACPFLSKPRMRRNEVDMPGDALPPAGLGIKRNPGVCCIWVTKDYKVWKDEGGGILFRIGDPLRVMWFAEGRTATRAEVDESIRTGLPILQETARDDGPEAEQELEVMVHVAEALLPAA